MAGSLPNFHNMDSMSACIQGLLKVKVKVKGDVIRTLSCILGMSYSVTDGLVLYKSSRYQIAGGPRSAIASKHGQQSLITGASQSSTSTTVISGSARPQLPFSKPESTY